MMHASERTKQIVITGLATAVICVVSMISIPLQPVPFTLSLFAIFLTGALLSPKSAFFAALVYLMIGACGVPVFAGMRGGLSVLLGVTGGYLVAYPLMSMIVALSVKLLRRRNVLSLSIGMLIALLVCYLIGTVWFCLVMQVSFAEALAVCVIPFVAFDLLKAALALALALVLARILSKSGVIMAISQ